MSVTPTEAKDVRLWKNLMSWLGSKGMDISPGSLPIQLVSRPGAGRGLFTSDRIEPSTLLLKIPSSALLNIRTLAPIYPYLSSDYSSSRTGETLILNATQLISLHVALHRPFGCEDSLDPDFGPFISVLPIDFDDHPLTWLVRQQQGTAKPHEVELLNTLPPSATSELAAVVKRYWEDWRVIVRCMEAHSEKLLASSNGKGDACVTEEDFLWGWLNVNTRCIYFQFFPSESHPSNLTLCPILDFMNHATSSSVPQVTPQFLPLDVWNNSGLSLNKDRDFVFESPRHAIAGGQELYLRYGTHANRTLFAEYGFVDVLSDMADGEADVSDLVEDLLARRGDVGAQMRDVLEEEKYTGEWKLFASPGPAHPSWTLLAALRLLNLELPSGGALSSDREELKPWRHLILGVSDSISEENEGRVAASLSQICETVLLRSQKSIEKLERHRMFEEGENNICLWLVWAQDNIRRLWQEEAAVAKAVLTSIDQHVTF